MRRFVVLVVAALVALAVASPAVAAGGRQLPFHMRLSGMDRPLDMSPAFPFGSTFDGRCTTPSSWVATIDSAGTAEHLGRVLVVNTHCTQFDVFAPSPTHATFTDGRMVIRAANGDEVWVHYSGSFWFYPTTAEDVGRAELTYGPMTIVGGTGRFVHATGSIDGTATDLFPAGGNAGAFDGVIVYQASDRAG